MEEMSKHQKRVILNLIADLLKDGKGWEIRAIYSRLQFDNGINLIGSPFINDILSDERFYMKNLRVYLKKEEKKDSSDVYSKKTLRILKDFLENPEKYSPNDVKNLLQRINRVNNRDIIKDVLDSYQYSITTTTIKGL